MEEHLEEDYPLLVALMRVECKDWSFLNTAGPDNDLDDNIDEVLGKTAWGLLQLFETKLRELVDLRKKVDILEGLPKIREIKAMRCPFNPDIGCMDGKTGVLEEFFNEDDQGTIFRESGIMCAAWVPGHCIRLGKNE